jgi:hypothetical protein
MSKLQATASPVSGLRRPNRPKWLLIAGLILIGLAVAAIQLILSLIDKVLQEAIAETDRLDPGWRTGDLELKRAIVPDQENSTLLIMAAARG